MPPKTLERSYRLAFQGPWRGNPADADSQALGGEAPQPLTSSGAVYAALRSVLLTLYSLFLLVQIAVYYAAIAIAIFELLRLGGPITRGLGMLSPWWLAIAVLAVVVLFLLTRLVTHFWRGVSGLVTQRYDPVPETSHGILLPADRYPDLYAMVAEVGQLIGSPTADEIRVTPGDECFAVEVRSFAISTDRRLVLMIGMAQLEVMSQAELKVVIAHELAHMGGGDTRLIVFVFRFLESLRQAQLELAGTWWRWIDPVSWLSWIYFHVLLILLAPIRKHQEFRADGWSAAAFGGSFAAHTLLKDWLVQLHFEEAVTRFRREHSRNTGSAPNLFRDFAENFHDLTPEGQEYLERRLREEDRVSYWDSHPTIPERMLQMRRYADRETSEPIPARLLLPDFDGLETQLEKAWLQQLAKD